MGRWQRMECSRLGAGAQQVPLRACLCFSSPRNPTMNSYTIVDESSTPCVCSVLRVILSYSRTSFRPVLYRYISITNVSDNYYVHDCDSDCLFRTLAAVSGRWKIFDFPVHFPVHGQDIMISWEKREREKKCLPVLSRIQINRDTPILNLH